MVRKWSILLAAVVCLSVFGACGQATNNKIYENSTTEKRTTVATPDKNENGTLIGTSNDNYCDEKQTETIPANLDTNLNINEIRETIDAKLDLIISNNNYTTEQEFIDANYDAIAELVSLGEDALPYLEECKKGIKSYDSSPDNLRRIVAAIISNIIKPELYDLYCSSPDGKYTVKGTADSFFGLTDPFCGIDYKLCVIDNESGEIVVQEDTIFNFPSLIYDINDIKWSINCEYVAVEQGYRHDYTNVYVFDIARGECFELPSKEEIEKITAKNLSYYDEANALDFENVHCLFDEWGTNTIKVKLILSSNVGGEYDLGSYTFDLSTRHIENIELHL